MRVDLASNFNTEHYDYELGKQHDNVLLQTRDKTQKRF